MANEVPWPLLQLLIGARSRDFLSVPENAPVPAFPDVDLDVTIYAYIGADPTADPSTWSAPVNLSALLVDEPIQITEGRSAGQRTLSSGSCTFYLDNTNGELTPLNGSSPWYGTWDLGVPVQLLFNNVGTAPPYSMFCGFASAIDTTIIPGVGGVNLSVVKVTLGGIVRQRSQGAVEQSCYRRWVAAQSPTAWWSLEDGPLGTGLADTEDTQPIGAFTPTLTSRRTFGGGDLAPWLLPGVGFEGSASTELVGVLPGGPYTDIAMDVLMLGSDTSSPSTAGLTIIGFDTGNGIWSLGSLYNSGSPTLYVTDTSFANLDTGTSAQALAAWDGEMHVWRLRLTESGADVLVRVYLDGVEIMNATKTTADLTNVVQVRCGANAVSTRVFGHIVITTETGITDPADVATAAFGFTGEQAHARIMRVCAEENVTLSTAATEGQLMGPQYPADFLTILRDAEAVDHGFLMEAKQTWGLKYLSGAERYNRPAAMTIDLSTYRLSDGTAPTEILAPVRNDQRIRNEWTITRPDGAAGATVLDAAHQATKGRYNDSAEVSAVDDDALVNEAAWRVWEGTFNGLRYAPGTPVDLAANNGGTDGSDALLAAWLDMDLGDRIDRTNPPSQHPNSTARLVVEGRSQTIRRRSWVAKLTLEPFDTWSVLALAYSAINVATDGWLNWDTCTLAADVDMDDISWSVACSPVTATAAENYPTVVNVEGELVTVTAVSGSSSPQTWTVTRSANGVTKSHDAGVAIESTELLIATL